MPWLPKPPPKSAPKRDVRMAPAPPSGPQRPTAPRPQPAAPRAKLDPRFEGKAAKQQEERRLRALREQKLQQGATASWRGMDRMGVPASIRRTPFDREEPSVSQKIQDVLGDAKEKEGRAKNREKGKRQSGTR